MSPYFFQYGQGVIVDANGPGRIHLLSYGANQASNTAHIGTITTASEGKTRFIISHSYDYTKFAFFWDGAGEAVSGLGQQPFNQAVGKSWEEATCADYNTNAFATRDVTAATTDAVTRDNLVTCFIIPVDTV
ncbi:hypothetical protein GALMADRAFT_411187 [Galerina marginata CBS 339.88]|uniref:Uncharacterized protein n=1 Tax=Galerina marginata (strain CBS 339.88) TaxID=685588 RepID=A0A067T5Q7_GALM3|nr:hypothetical protein GALMADRAFT_411187 [Galerina marginata CBS 339.88]